MIEVQHIQVDQLIQPFLAKLLPPQNGLACLSSVPGGNRAGQRLCFTQLKGRRSSCSIPAARKVQNPPWHGPIPRRTSRRISSRVCALPAGWLVRHLAGSQLAFADELAIITGALNFQPSSQAMMAMSFMLVREGSSSRWVRQGRWTPSFLQARSTVTSAILR